MKRILLFLMALSLCLAVCGGCTSSKAPQALSAAEFSEKYHLTASSAKIILDTDARYLNDDCRAMLGLLQADTFGFVDLLGITTVGGNTFCAPAAYDTLSLLEHIGRTDIPVYMGEDKPLNGFADIEKLQEVCGKMGYTGAYAMLSDYTNDPKAQNGLQLSPWAPPSTTVAQESAVDFMINAVKSAPGEVTIVAIGALTNIARALEKYPAFAEQAARIVYMGGVFDIHGEELPHVEINWWYDPHATNLVLHAPWRSQVAVSYDAATRCLRGKDMYDRFVAANTNVVAQTVIEPLRDIYENGQQEALPFCWDPLVLAELLAPELITDKAVREVYVSEQEDFTYGSVFAWYEGTGPALSAPIQVVLAVNRDGFWSFLSELYALTE